METLHWEPSCSMQTEGQADSHDKANSHFLQSFNAPKNKFKMPAVKYNVMQEIKL